MVCLKIGLVDFKTELYLLFFAYFLTIENIKKKGHD